MNNEKNKKNNRIKNDNNNKVNNIKSDNNSKNKNSIFRPNNSGLINHLKKENERLRKLVISYEFKNKRYNNINNIYNTNKNNTEFLISKFNFEIIKKFNNNENQLNNKNKDKIIISKYNFSNKSFGTFQKIKNTTKIVKKPEIKKIKDINMFDNDIKENRFSKYYDFKEINNIKIDRTNSLSQRKRRFFNVGNTNINSNTLRIKSIVNANNKNLHNNVLLQYKNLSGSRSLSKLKKRKKINDYSLNNSIKLEKNTIGVIKSYEQQINMIKSNKNKIMKTIENKRNDNSSLDKEFFFSTTSRQPKHSHIIKKKNKNNDSKKEIYYQKPIINKITIYNNINNGKNNYPKQKIHLNVKTRKVTVGKKQSYNKNDNYFNCYTVGI